MQFKMYDVKDEKKCYKSTMDLGNKNMDLFKSIQIKLKNSRHFKRKERKRKISFSDQKNINNKQ